jgi:hypothetical protein
MSSENPSACAACAARDARDARARKHLDYNQLNDGSDYEADIADQMERTSIVSIE